MNRDEAIKAFGLQRSKELAYIGEVAGYPAEEIWHAWKVIDQMENMIAERGEELLFISNPGDGRGERYRFKVGGVKIGREAMTEYVRRLLMDAADAAVKGETCDCASRDTSAREARFEKAKTDADAALASGNRIEFIRIVREQIEAELEDGVETDDGTRLGRGLIAAVQALGMEHVPVREGIDATSYWEEVEKPAHEALKAAVYQILEATFSD